MFRNLNIHYFMNLFYVHIKVIQIILKNIIGFFIYKHKCKYFELTINVPVWKTTYMISI